jgi:CubicO group peptidase (beta-lactamase class C family)
MEVGRIPGMTVTIVKQDKVVWQKGYGKAHLEFNAPMARDATLEIGSVTKQMTGLGILLLVKEGKVKLDEPITTYLKNVPKSWEKVSVRQALSHTGGLREYLSGGFDFRIDHRPSQLLEFMSRKELDFAPGTGWMYSNGGYAVAGAIIEEVSGQTWREFMRTRVFLPAGMKNTLAQNRSLVIPGRAQGYTPSPGPGGRALTMDAGRQSVLYAAGAIISTGPDMALWLKGIDRDVWGLGELRQELFRPQTFVTGRTWNYGLGWFLSTAFGYQYYGHGGNTYGFSSYVAWFPQERVGVVLLSNAAGQNLEGLALSIGRRYLKNPKDPVLPTRQKDPNPERTFRLVRALNTMVERTPDRTLVDDEIFGLLQTERGSAIKNSLRAGFGRFRAAFYKGERKIGDDVEVTYEVVGTRIANRPAARVTWRFLLSSEGKLVRIEDLFFPRT